MNECPICLKQFDVNILSAHAEYCNDFQHDDSTKYVEPILTTSQINAYKYCKLKSKIHSAQTRGNILIRFIGLGYDENDLNNVINYLKHDTRVTINIKHDTILQFLTKEENIKNGFETGRVYCGNNNARKTWETNLFNKEYDDANPIEKVKYGALNMFNEKNGVSACLGYGDVFFVLKKEVNNRISFVNGDSSGMMFHICTFKYPTALLVHLPDAHLKNFIMHVRNEKPSTTNYNYIEAQIHGPIRINTDIEKLVIPSNCLLKTTSRDKLDKLKTFCEERGIKFVCD